MTNQEIKCGVASCKFNESASYCALRSITVGSDVPSGLPHSKNETNCASFSCK